MEGSGEVDRDRRRREAPGRSGGDDKALETPLKLDRGLQNSDEDFARMVKLRQMFGDVGEW